ncbi:MAG: cupin domain-containing protein [Oligoflexia bacterium]|nr:cupin domain-containing protein [Oligoflexia bacterium]MBF0365426.1 cupin domain-containing protein [Oligoflexia bacterium]
MEKAKKFELPQVVQYQKGGIVSLRVHENASGGITVFAFDEGQRLSEHSAPFDAVVTVLEGNGEIVIGGTAHALKTGETIIMPANIPHAVNAHEPFKMMLVMIRG